MELFQLDSTFRQRGLVPVGGVSYQNLILPATREDEDYFRFLLNSRNRKLLSKIAGLGRRGTEIDADQVVNAFQVKEDETLASIQQLVAFGLLRRIGSDKLITLFTANDFGKTFEWLVAQWLRREASMPADWSVRLKGSPGGDFDVLARGGERLFYVECKTGNPQAFRSNDFWQFFRRLIWLHEPTYGVLVFDTESSLEGLIARLADDWRRFTGADRGTGADVFGDMASKGKRGVWESRSDWFCFVNAKPRLTASLREALKTAAAVPMHQSGWTLGRLGGRQDFSMLPDRVSSTTGPREDGCN